MGNSAFVTAIPASEFESWRPKLDTHLASFCERSGGSLEIERLVSDIMAEGYQVWAVIDGNEVLACALTFLQDDAKKTCVISHCSGRDYEQWAGQLLATIRVWSHSLGSTKLEAVTRSGWEKVLRKFGMVKTHVILELKENG